LALPLASALAPPLAGARAPFLAATPVLPLVASAPLAPPVALCFLLAMTFSTRSPIAGGKSRPKPRLWLGFLLLAIVAILAGQSSVATAQTAQISAPPLAGSMAKFKPAPAGKAAPAILALDARDQPLDPGKYAGKLVVLNFWATWCVPCVKEMPSLDRMQAALAAKGVMVLPLSLDGPTKPRVQPFFDDKKLAHLPILFDQGNKTFGASGATVLPTTILLRDGKELGRIEGPAEWDDPDATALLQFYLDRKS
jgi:thiol-disulfide isomerase/thioredoxin